MTKFILGALSVCVGFLIWREKERTTFLENITFPSFTMNGEKFKCETCTKDFESIVLEGQEYVECPNCHQKQAVK